MCESVRISFIAALPSAIRLGKAFELKLHLCSEAGQELTDNITDVYICIS
jgi:hypothetical protein